MRADKKSLVVVGGGPGGYVAAIRAAQLGGEVTLIERAQLGGTCLNTGCIPTKALLHAAALAAQAGEGAACGVHLRLERIDWREALAFKDSVVGRLRDGVRSLLQSNGVRIRTGTAAFAGPKVLEMTEPDGRRQMVEADRFILATGSDPVVPPVEGLRDSPHVLDSTGVLQMERLPQRMLIIGGGVIGVELACMLHGLGCGVTIVEALPTLTPTLDGELSAALEQGLRRQGIAVFPGHRVTRVCSSGGGAQVFTSCGGTEQNFTAEKILCAVGRRPRIDGLNAERGGIRCEGGQIAVDAFLETSTPGVYAVGDCVGQHMLAHTASAQGETAAENAMGGRVRFQPEAVPFGVYAFPEAAGVGLTEEQAKERNIPYHTGRFPLRSNGRALIANGGEGLVKILLGDELGQVLGVHILGPNATELIGEAAVAISMEATAAELIHTIHAHPTVAEAIREAAMAAEGRAIHLAGPRKGGARI